jgi:hypothetical protein
VPELRRAAFVAAVAVLVAALVLVLVGPRPTPSAPAPSTRRPASRVDDPGRARPAPIRARTQVRRFVLAFLAYEVDLGDARDEVTIRAGASRSFSRRLLSEPPVPPRGAPPPAVHLTSLRVDPLPGHPDLALVSGEARRAEGPEPFAFLFARNGEHWLAVAPGE